MEKQNEYKLNDFYQAVILKTTGFNLLRLEKGSGRYVYFVFNDPEQKAEEIIERYWNRDIQVIARDLIENINELKTRIHLIV